MTREEPYTLKAENIKIKGVLRYSSKSAKIVILLPSFSGTRIGPQRLYTELSRSLLKKNVASLCVDIPNNGESMDLREETSRLVRNTIANFSYYIDLIINDIKSRLKYTQLYVLSISDGCVPCFNCALTNSFDGAVLLSPNPFINKIMFFNKKNYKSYLYKIIRRSTWKKVIEFNFDLKKVVLNVFRFDALFKSIVKDINRSNKENNLFNDFIPVEHFSKSKLRLLCLYGDKDLEIIGYIRYWRTIKKTLNIKDFEEHVIENCDHSYFGWNNKQKAIKLITEWF